MRRWAKSRSNQEDFAGHVACYRVRRGRRRIVHSTRHFSVYSRGAAGFISGRIFLSEDGESVVSLVEWRESFTQFRQTEFVRMAAQVIGELRPRPYWLKSYASLEKSIKPAGD